MALVLLHFDKLKRFKKGQCLTLSSLSDSKKHNQPWVDVMEMNKATDDKTRPTLGASSCNATATGAVVGAEMTVSFLMARYQSFDSFEDAHRNVIMLPLFCKSR